MFNIWDWGGRWERRKLQAVRAGVPVIYMGPVCVRAHFSLPTTTIVLCHRREVGLETLWNFVSWWDCLIFCLGTYKHNVPFCDLQRAQSRDCNSLAGAQILRLKTEVNWADNVLSSSVSLEDSTVLSLFFSRLQWSSAEITTMWVGLTALSGKHPTFMMDQPFVQVSGTAEACLPGPARKWL